MVVYACRFSASANHLIIWPFLHQNLDHGQNDHFSAFANHLCLISPTLAPAVSVLCGQPFCMITISPEKLLLELKNGKNKVIQTGIHYILPMYQYNCVNFKEFRI